SSSSYSCLFESYRPHRHLHSFPTRRSSDLWRKLEEILDSASEGSEGFELLLDERQIHVCLLCEVRTLARRCLRICRHPIGRHFMYLVTIGSLFKGKTEKSF